MSSSEGNPPPNPAPGSRRKERGPFINGCYAGFAISIFPMLVAGAFFGERPNVMLAVFGIVVLLWLVMLIYHVVWSNSSVFAYIAGVTCVSWIAALMSLSQPAQVLTAEYKSIPLVEQFAQSDFARFQGESLSVSQLQSVVDGQTALQNAIASVENSEKAVDAAPINDADKAIVHVADAAAQTALKAQLESPEEMARLQAVITAACDASSAPKADHDCTVTQADLQGFAAKFQRDYATWLVLLRFIGAV